ncbi:transcription-repair coupling factor [Limosilactobacillus sp. STM2_1]|uniref:Transcription-repair-coupling factor n=1 Tax=Limosilactobacillus rudii TaxID=2759755 RepID=A0A7W3ULD6_9LACO|nr:transcription-repair coupling factor [Limosilactobacillus rudii]MBB1079611.1 transcription-repair coupling factor [Limosilactobacillus rudii]MBB1097689.1 transcription-repair coupling factor [Limosilactobacillus rudii]MCD7134798.1 transcription-repair coupling factor [Limosilactobacillus rudii]
MAQLENLVERTPSFKHIMADLEPSKHQLITGISGSVRTVFLSTILKQAPRPILVVTDTISHMQELASDLDNLMPDNKVYQFPVEEVLAAEVATSSPNYRLQRVLALNALINHEQAVIVASVAGLRRNVVSPAYFAQAKLKIKTGGEVDPSKVRQQLSAMGYQLQKMVLRPGDFAIRGSIIDIYALNTDNPVRIDLFDTEVDSLRYFDASTQRSIDNIDTAEILPATDFILPPAEFARVQQALDGEYKQLITTLSNEDADIKQQLANRFEPLLSALKSHHLTNDLLEFSNLIYPTKHSLLNYLPDNGLIYFDDLTRVKQTAKKMAEEDANWFKDKVAHHQLTTVPDLSNNVATMIKTDKHAQIYGALFKKGLGKIKLSQITDLGSRTMQRFFGQMPLLKAELARWTEQGQTVILMANSPERRKQIARTLADFGITATETELASIKPNIVQIVAANLNNGFEMPHAGIVIITESEMFKQVKKVRHRPQKLANAERLKSYTDLKPGDYVVHVNHGIGIFSGIKTMEVDGVHQDYMVINYRNNAQIYVPVTQLNLVQKYVSSESKTPRINKLGGNEWAKTKRRVSSKIEDIADELVDLYAKREAEKGYAFPKDDYLQKQFDANFPYSETRDQLRSINEIKEDMEKPKPMDRLLVGDVGYGKTEVAMRAIFKAVTGGKQVAFLVPTTVLAQQHFDTLQRRFEGFPINIALMSRFKTPKELRETEVGLKDGSIDVVVGTHRILSKDVEFKDLGLLIVDEEQRFGVKHKEKLKQLKNNVDVLTLTATPIPRTLHMSMLGVRDLSVLETPPAGRYPIQTYVMEQNSGAIRDGIIREMQRGGQVYYLHNRVHDIEETVARLQELVPEAQIGYINGQMSENELETVLYEFIQGNYDVLVTTSIIETGVDIPNANTLFVENADRMGLAQLYQIRGRIGRSNRVAYAYFMYQPNKVLTELGEKRLAAIRDFTELGSGFKIAMRDLAIRGAGNLLGKQQHGFIDSVGYDLYSAMLSDAVAKKQGKKQTIHSDAEVELGVEAYLPTDYVNDQRQKIELYKTIRQAKTDDEIIDIQGDLIDRFGDYPAPVGTLLLVSQLKNHADLAMIEEIKRQRDNINIVFTERASRLIKAPAIIKELAKTRFKATIGEDNNKVTIRLVIQPKMTTDDWLHQLLQFVTSLGEVIQNDEQGETK